MDRRTTVLGVTLLGALPAACGGGSGGSFQTSIPGNTPLGSLSGSQATTLCNDETRFAQQSSFEMDACRETAFLTVALTVTLTPYLTDADVRAACTSAYDSCLHPDGGAGASQTCTAPSANCTATVSELAACLDDEAAAVRALAAQVPDCSSITRASLTPNDGGIAGLVTTSAPASCQVLQQKCSGASAAAQSFAQAYCALVAPCCAAGHSASGCEALVLGAAGTHTFDQTAATTCLAALQARPAGTGFCAGLATLPSSANGFAVIPECASVFGPSSAGTLAAGQPCNMDSDCAPGPSGPAACEPDIFLSGGSNDGGSFCAVITTKLSDPCIGTASPSQRSFEGMGSPVGYTFCDQDQGLMCSPSYVCVPIGGLSDPCDSSDQCDGIKTYCDFGRGTCQSRLPAGAACTNALGACVDGADCDPTTSVCRLLDGAGAACSATFPSNCLAGYCGSDGTCPDPLAGLCS